MALTTKQRNAIFQAVRDAALAANPRPMPWNKETMHAAADAAELWISAAAQQAAFNLALPAAFRTTATNQDKQFLFAATALALLPRASIEAIAITALRLINGS